MVATRQEHESWLQDEHDGTFGIVVSVPTLIWAVVNMAVHMYTDKEVFASVAYVISQTVIFKGLKLKQIKQYKVNFLRSQHWRFSLLYLCFLLS